MTEEEVPFEEEVPEVPEEQEEVLPPDPPPLKRSGKSKLQDRVECGDCGRQVSRHTLLHTHRCPAKKKREAAETAEPVETPVKTPVETPVEKPKRKAAPKVKPALPESEVQKPLKQRAVIKKAEKAREE